MNYNGQQPIFSTHQFNTTAYDDRMPRELLYRSKRNLTDLITLIDRHFQHHSRILVIRIDLKYRQEVSQSIPIDMVQMHRERLLENRTSHPEAFRGLLGYAWGLEYGEYGSGWHHHFLLLYDGADRHDAIHISLAIGQLWDTITGGLGYCFPCNFNTDRLRSEGVLGIGMIHRHEHELRRNLIERVAPYITKKCVDFDERSNRSASGDFRTFGRSNMPPEFDPNAPRRGRPPVR